MDDEKLDWCYDDPVLTAQLKAVKTGRGWIVTMIVGGLALLSATIVFLA